MNVFFKLLLLATAINCSLQAEINEKVPVLIWGNFDHYTPAVAVKTYSSGEFSDIINSHMTADTFTVVIQENYLSTEDLSLCKTPNGDTCFQGIQRIPSKLYLANVEDPITALENLSGNDQSVVSITTDGVLSETIDNQPGKFLFITLQDSVHNEPKAVQFKRHDEIITRLAKQLAAENENVLIIYTAKYGSRQNQSGRKIRAAEDAAPAAASKNETSSAAADKPAAAPVAAPKTPPKATPKQDDPTVEREFFFNRTRLLVYFNSLTFDDEILEVADVTVVEKPRDENNPVELDVQFTLANGSDVFKFTVSGSGGYWSIGDFFHYDEPILLQRLTIQAVDRFSYHCSPSLLFSNSIGEPINLKWTGLQIQPFLDPVVESMDSFGDSWDCVAFLSPGILGGLFVVFLLLIILFIGISWMMDIRTMDRFDDPKGKTIIVSATD